uniref:30S ribosomal protein S13 n=1 Tax=Magnolia sieboldii TaxID=85868 RepID=A0A7G8KP45_9MAGN|nr:30S ribosomal protein S13 [Magnolia sieboldii]
MAQTLAMPISPSISIVSKGGNPSFCLPNPSTISFSSNPSSSLNYRGLSIRCARVGGVEIPNNKRIESSLQYIHGIGRTRARQILCDLTMQNKVTKDLSEDELIIIRDEVSKGVSMPFRFGG